MNPPKSGWEKRKNKKGKGKENPGEKRKEKTGLVT